MSSGIVCVVHASECPSRGRLNEIRTCSTGPQPRTASPLICGWTAAGLFRALAVANNAVRYRCARVSLGLCFQFFRVGAQKLDRVLIHSAFNSSRHRQPVLRGGCTILPSHRLRLGFPSPHFLPTCGVVLFVILIVAPNRREVLAHVVLICISFMISDLEHLFHALIGHSYMSFGRMSTRVFCQRHAVCGQVPTLG